jgi:hypothetical protein
VKLLALANDRATAINSRDPSNCTPLMIAALSASGRVSLPSPAAPVTCCAALIGLGANKRAKNSDGSTAHALVKKSIKSGEKFDATFGLQSNYDYSDLLAVLKP